MSDLDLASPAAAAPAERRATLLALAWQAALPIALVVLLLGFAAVDSAVLTPGNLVNIVQQASYLALFAMAQTVVILTRGFDLALGPTVSMVSVGAALAMAAGVAGGQEPGTVLLMGLAAGFALGAACGVFNGVVIAYLGVSPFVATLGSYNIAIGVATTISSGRPVQGVPDLFSWLLYGGSPFGVPAAIVITVIVGIALHLVLTRTVYGRALYIIGTNPRAAAVAGLPVKRLLVATYVLCSSLAALGALMMTARTGSGEPNLGGSLSLQAIAAAVVGGTSLAGGRGGVGTAVVGALFVTILSNGMNLTRIDGYVQMVVLGAIVIAGVVLDRLRLERRG
ncbi:inner-membrane translocator [Ancylobacter novellus DSM 506]|uniref:Inner-membrane translocator n=1 Tax=Ancylobacter novellus (strain ATCC 8093 / DSM 506 / JCM 20403 / CCM 1077 / IAM 12100 / NBRC 12443 / NCIMB 10456) TaxID=639283 RepID=D7A9U6_ANCN5|nr:ABC transporter permease [Ancylobacter novellus]ADH88872.1 inner-membrane translocator [Ancylobacter novellus DSM 506]